MKFRIEEYRGLNYGPSKRFTVQIRQGNWPFTWWATYYPHDGLPPAWFDTLEEARAWLVVERKRLEEKAIADKAERKLRQPIYHKP